MPITAIPSSRQWRFEEEWGTVAEFEGLHGASSGGSLLAYSSGSPPCYPPSSSDPRQRPPPPCNGCDEPRF